MNGEPMAVLGIPSHQRRRFVKESKRHRLDFVSGIQTDRRIGRRLPTGALADLADAVMHILIDVGPDRFNDHRHQLGDLPSPIWEHVDSYVRAMSVCVMSIGGSFSASEPVIGNEPPDSGRNRGSQDLAILIAAEAVKRARLKTIPGAERPVLERTITEVVGEHGPAVGSRGSTSGEYIARVWDILREHGVVIESPLPLFPDLIDLRAWP